MAERLLGPERLGPEHRLEQFASGVASLDGWLRRHARQSAAIGSARTFVLSDPERRVVGYHALAAGYFSSARSLISTTPSGGSSVIHTR